MSTDEGYGFQTADDVVVTEPAVTHADGRGNLSPAAPPDSAAVDSIPSRVVLVNPRTAANDAEHVLRGESYVRWRRELQLRLDDFVRNPSQENERLLGAQLVGYCESFIVGSLYCPDARHE